MKDINEEKIYEMLGVNTFKKLVFALEKFIHRKDKGKNINYHIKKGNNIESINDFKKYFYYNGKIHVKNLVIGNSILIAMILLNIKFYFMIPLLLLLIKDAYCVMLQRYNYLKVIKHEKKLNQRRKMKITNQINNFDKNIIHDNIISRDTAKENIIRDLELLRCYLLGVNNKNIELNDSMEFINEQVINKKVLRKED